MSAILLGWLCRFASNVARIIAQQGAIGHGEQGGAVSGKPREGELPKGGAGLQACIRLLSRYGLQPLRYSAAEAARYGLDCSAKALLHPKSRSANCYSLMPYEHTKASARFPALRLQCERK
jgi:hypothetical protein